MMRFLSVLLLVAGLGAALYSVSQMLTLRAPAETAMSTPDMPVPEAASAPAEAAMDTPPPEPMKGEPIQQAPPGEVGAEQVTQPAETGSELERALESVGDDVLKDLTRSLPPPNGETFDTGGATVPETPAGPSRADTFLQRLQTVPVAHETPVTAEYKRAFDVSFAIDATGDTTAADALPGRGNIETGEAKVSERVAVRVSGAAFEISGASPEVQSLSPVTENVWRWSVTPQTAGQHDLTFEVFAIDNDDVTPLRTFSDTVTVKVSGVSAAVAFADRVNPLFVLLGGLGSALAGAFGVARFFMTKK